MNVAEIVKVGNNAEDAEYRSVAESIYIGTDKLGWSQDHDPGPLVNHW